jgi:hypothetical protein
VNQLHCVQIYNFVLQLNLNEQAHYEAFEYQERIGSDPLPLRGLSTDRENREAYQQVKSILCYGVSLVVVGNCCIKQMLCPQDQASYIRSMEAAAAADSFYTTENENFRKPSQQNSFHELPSKCLSNYDQVGRYQLNLFL